MLLTLTPMVLSLISQRAALISLIRVGIAARGWGMPVAPLIVVAVGIAIVRLIVIARAVRVR